MISMDKVNRAIDAFNRLDAEFADALSQQAAGLQKFIVEWSARLESQATETKAAFDEMVEAINAQAKEIDDQAIACYQLGMRINPPPSVPQPLKIVEEKIA